MRYYIDKPPIYLEQYGKTYICNHPAYDRCTLYVIHDYGLAVIQQRFEPEGKRTWWGEIDPWLVDIIYLNKGFKKYFDQKAWLVDEHGLFPTVTVRQIMWALRMKPIPKEPWETVFDHSPF